MGFKAAGKSRLCDGIGDIIRQRRMGAGDLSMKVVIEMQSTMLHTRDRDKHPIAGPGDQTDQQCFLG